ncbi:MAG: hypothetical protein BWZ03_00613 [bacterium ADurb.BinA186]|nr:MAG: hypothetical protein BWZ03_00613 [bacterium ADurb.BinA186]
MKKDIDKILELHFREQPDFCRLDGMERVLWQKIEESRGKRLWMEHLLETFAWPRFQITTLGISLVIGFSVGLVQPWSSKTESSLNNFEKSMSMFALNSDYLPSTALSTVQSRQGVN